MTAGGAFSITVDAFDSVGLTQTSVRGARPWWSPCQVGHDRLADYRASPDNYVVRPVTRSRRFRRAAVHSRFPTPDPTSPDSSGSRGGGSFLSLMPVDVIDFGQGERAESIRMRRRCGDAVVPNQPATRVQRERLEDAPGQLRNSVRRRGRSWRHGTLPTRDSRGSIWAVRACRECIGASVGRALGTVRSAACGRNVFPRRTRRCGAAIAALT